MTLAKAFALFATELEVSSGSAANETALKKRGDLGAGDCARAINPFAFGTESEGAGAA